MRGRLVLIDTSAWIFALRRPPHPLVKDRVDELLGENRVAIMPMISLELLGGTRSEGEFERLKSRLEALHQVSIGKREWYKAAWLAFELRRQGKTIPYTDILIATVALLYDLILLHVDSHFDLIAEEVPLRVESFVGQL